MFSARASQPVTFTRRPRRAAVTTAANTAAAPLMSHFIVSLWPAGLSEMPPESYVMPLPTRATDFFAFGWV